MKKPREYKHPIARRIIEGAAAKGLSLRGLGRDAGLAETTPQKICQAFEDLGLAIEDLARADEGSDIGLLSLAKMAKAMDRPLHWLLYGDGPLAPLRDQKGWTEAAAEAVRKYRLHPADVETIGALPIPAPATGIDEVYVRDLVRTQLGR